ncbi:MAG: FMN-binding protein [Clostridiales bacterium]|nr:FMN-binding protein [Clostridiales bacterium]
MTKKILIAALVLCLLAGALLLLFGLQLKTTLASLQVSTPDIGELHDGVYKGAYDGRLVSAKVTVTIIDGLITSITIDEHKNGRGTPAEIIIDNVISAQSLEVDTITGATQSSKVILKAIEEALGGEGGGEFVVCSL